MYLKYIIFNSKNTYCLTENQKTVKEMIVIKMQAQNWEIWL